MNSSGRSNQGALQRTAATLDSDGSWEFARDGSRFRRRSLIFKAIHQSDIVWPERYEPARPTTMFPTRSSWPA
jgi:hypothetical protein